jgi:AGCS family alanine or glycine:cation symporter
MCTITGLVILTSGLWYAEPKIPETSLCAAAFEQSFFGGQYLVTVCLVLFAFATVIAWYYYGEKCVEYIFPKHRTAVGIYRFIYIGTVFTASLLRLDFVWAFTDLFNGLMALPNLIALFVLSPVIRRLTDNFFKDPHRLRADDENFSRFLLLKKR